MARSWPVRKIQQLVYSDYSLLTRLHALSLRHGMWSTINQDWLPITEDRPRNYRLCCLVVALRTILARAKASLRIRSNRSQKRPVLDNLDQRFEYFIVARQIPDTNKIARRKPDQPQGSHTTFIGRNVGLRLPPDLGSKVAAWIAQHDELSRPEAMRLLSSAVLNAVLNRLGRTRNSSWPISSIPFELKTETRAEPQALCGALWLAVA
jgi:hypothetical protein